MRSGLKRGVKYCIEIGDKRMLGVEITKAKE